MQRRSLEEKLAYNSKRQSEFASGYDLAVTLYKAYIKSPESVKKSINTIFDNARKNLKTSRASLKTAVNDMAKANAQKAVDYNNGILCGMRDAANERKARKK